MTQLSAQAIRERCLTPGPKFNSVMRNNTWVPMLAPFEPEKKIVHGKSYGLSAASYDLRIAHDLILGPSPAGILKDLILGQYRHTHRAARFSVPPVEHDPMELVERLSNLPPHCALAHTVEDFFVPTDVTAQVADKSSYARVFVSAFNTFIDPGFQGNLTLELVNHGEETVVIEAGSPICQVIFTFLDRPTDRPYNGKYMHQTKRAHAARVEASDGSWTVR